MRVYKKDIFRCAKTQNISLSCTLSCEAAEWMYPTTRKKSTNKEKEADSKESNMADQQ